MINKIKNKSKKNSIFRFPPDPNGYLHIGHVFNILTNYYLSFLKNGNFLIRFDNTNLSKIKIKYYYFILYDLIWLGIKWHKIKYFLNEIRFNKYLLFFFLKKKKIYLKKKYFILRINFNYLNYIKIIELINFNYFIKKNFSIFCKKKIIYRKKNKKKHKMFFPTYDFSQCFNDYLNKVNVSICTKEFKINSKIYNFFLNKLIKKPIQIEFEKKKIKNILMSKKKIKKIFFLNIFYFRKIKFNSKNIHYLCNNIGISQNNSFIKNKSILNSLLLEKNFFYFKNLFFKKEKILNLKKKILLLLFNNKKNTNLNLNITIIKNNIKINIYFLNFLIINNFFLFKKKTILKKYIFFKNITILIKNNKKIKINIFEKTNRHCLYDNKFKIYKNNLIL
ncbi:glutamate--tRNA ligase family protein [Candidatus Carsonella ruddii]|uniref:Glutamate--tRNA ligase family protein n=1 Tax=Carsonella ruddii TaxID=114186 RepID=A0AAJ6FBM9_CARRU|nr:glutamate--tRNA ligase family protein [Candidatus Carsonella ruddii]WGS66752.1 glutamate--tRNA ligase family protein [Candidatus Carsonella ruddii]WGS66946.1 glutamate--tRNA ligase family protein [Candidatus Carsonella ruddii]WGS67137.1 glutamate--tRNA ligase family protein [Candidatus Carsonella ruddii]WGS67329.1 glutamate--tRNA ligase family protein [Candidatus Carsonella ruddii]WMC18348.1 MAG: glutamate--tRNA ligase family protein [Candidatus Carsonella ruddii]